MEGLSNIFKPITANVLNKSDTYTEIEPCIALRPYIRCFWGSTVPYRSKESASSNNEKTLVIPDCCMDIIFDINYSSNNVENLFCSINDAPFYTEEAKQSAMVSTFGIRFNFWAVHLFVDSNLPKACNEFAAVDEYFGKLKNEIENIVLEYPKIEERVFYVENLLLRKLYTKSIVNNNLLNGIHCILKTKGMVSICEASQYTSISSRQLERIFKEYIGITPKKCASLVRYQNIWKDLILNKYCTTSDIAYNYGYSDQAHMINDFKKYHGSTPMEALRNFNK